MTSGSNAQQELMNRLKRIERQVRGIARMVENDTYCIDILTEVSAVSRALQGVALLRVEDHMRHFLLDAAQTGGAERESRLNEALVAIGRLARS